MSHLKALGKPEGSLPNDVRIPCEAYIPKAHAPAQIIVEAVVALALGVLGAVMRVDELKEITWRSEMKKRCVFVSKSAPLS